MHQDMESLADDVRSTEEDIKEQGKLDWRMWVWMAFLGLIAWSSDTDGLLRGLVVLIGMGFYLFYRWSQEATARLRLLERSVLSVARKTLPAEDPD